MKLFGSDPFPSEPAAWFRKSEVTLSNGFSYLIRKQTGKVSMRQALFETELSNLLAELNRALISAHKRRAEILADQIQVCLVDLWEARLRRV